MCLKYLLGGIEIVKKQRVKLGALLVQKKVITGKQLDDALRSQVIYGGRLGTNLVELGYLDEEALAYFLSEALEVPYAHPKTLLDIDRKLIALIPREIAEKYKILPFELKKKRLKVVMVDPQDIGAINEISFITGFIVEPMVTPEARLMEALEIYYDVPRGKRGIAMDRATEPPAVKAAPKVEKTYDLSGPEDSSVSEDLSGPDDLSEEILKEKVDKVKDKRKSMLSETAAAPQERPEIFDALKSAPDRDSLASALLDYAAGKYPNAAILIAKAGRAEGWKAAGGEFNDMFIQRVIVPLGVPGIFKDASDFKYSILSGPVKNPMDKMLRKLLKVEDSMDIVVSGIYFQKIVICFLLLVMSKGIADNELKAELIEVSEKAGEAFVRLIRERKRIERSA